MKAAKSIVLIHQRTRQRYPLRGDLVIGRSTGDLIFDQDPKLSGKHCLIRPTEEGGFAIYDLKSRTGVYINGTQLPQGKACILKAESEITVGDQTFLVTEDTGKTTLRDVAESTTTVSAKGALGGVLALALVIGVGLWLSRSPSAEKAPERTTAAARAEPQVSPLDVVEADVQDAISRYEAYEDSLRQHPRSEQQSLAYLREDLIPRLTKLNGQLQTVTVQSSEDKTRFDQQRKLASVYLGLVTARANFMETKDRRFAGQAGAYHREAHLLREAANRKPTGN